MPSFTPSQKPQAPATFDLVKQFDAMRNGQSGAPMSTAAYQPPAPAGGGHSEGDGHDHSADGGVDTQGTRGGYTPSGRMRAVGGYQFDEAFAPLVEDMAGRFKDLRVASGYRDPARNAAANGVKNSHHLTGNAADFSGSADAMQRGAAYAQSKGYRVLIHNAGSGMHLHISR